MGLREEFAADVQALSTATRYWIEVDVDFRPGAGSAKIEGVERVLFTNTSDRPLPDLVLMLWPNHEQYRSQMSAGPALIDGDLVPPEIELGGLALRFALPKPLPPGETLDFSAPFRIQVDDFGPLIPRRFGVTEGVLMAPTFYPILPRLLDEGWEMDPAAGGGDTTNSEVAFYRLQIRAPQDLTLVASGVEISRTETGSVQSVTYVTGPVRDIAFALGPFEHQERRVEGVNLHAWLLPQHSLQSRRLMDAAARQLSILTELWGAYPYVELDIVDAPGAFGGVEYPGLVFIGTLASRWIVSPTVHEVAHQWFYGVVGNDQLAEPWLDEALATYAETLFYENSAEPARATWMLSDFRARVRDHADPGTPIGKPVSYYSSENEYALFVYLKGALFFQTLRQEMGDRAFFEFLKTYYAQHRYSIASAGAFQSGAEAVCGCDLEDLFQLWVYSGGEVPGP